MPDFPDAVGEVGYGEFWGCFLWGGFAHCSRRPLPVSFRNTSSMLAFRIETFCGLCLCRKFSNIPWGLSVKICMRSPICSMRAWGKASFSRGIRCSSLSSSRTSWPMCFLMSSVGVPCSMILPWSIMRMRSHRIWASSM